MNLQTIMTAAFGFAAAITSAGFAQPVNDECFLPEPIYGFGSYDFSTVDATTDGEPVAACLFFGQDQIYKDIWYRWTCDDSTLIQISLCGASYDTKIAVYAGYPKGGCPDSMDVIACNDDSCSLQSVVTFAGESGAVYAIRIGSYGTPTSGGSTGTGTMTIGSGFLADVTDPNTGQRYALATSTTWNNAEALAQLVGGHLASIHSAEENEFIHQTFGNFNGQDRRLWIGFTDQNSEGEWYWSDGSAVDYTNWNPGEPNNANNVEHFAEMLGSNGAWNDLNDAGAGFVHLAVIELGGGGGGPGDGPGDIDGDGFVGGVDLGIVLADWGSRGSGDVDGSGVVDGIDLGIVLAGWGPCP